MTFEKLYDLNTVLTALEIEELRELCYELGNSAFPIDVFFNDIERNKSENYNKNQAYKDLWLVVLYFLECEKKLKALEIIKNKQISVDEFIRCCKKESNPLEDYNDFAGDENALTQQEYNLLKEVLL